MGEPSRGEHLVLDGLDKVYGAGVRAVKDIRITVSQGEFVALLGPSGCEKSTLLRMIAGLESISSGKLWISGREVSAVHPRDRDIAMVFQNYALYPHMSVAANLEYPLKLRGLPKAERGPRVEEIAALLELEPYLARKPGELSGGQRQRVAMGRALVRKPALFLMDEPLSNLDARLRQQMRIEIASLQRKLGITTIYVTHDQVEAMTMADRIVVMSGGEVQQVGKPYEVYLKPANIFVAGFMGAPAMNLMPATRLLSVGVMAARRHEGELVLGIRPEAILIEPADGRDGIALEGDVFALEALGVDCLCHVRLHAGGMEPLTVIARVPGNPQALNGTRVPLFLPTHALHLFDKANGRRIDD